MSFNNLIYNLSMEYKDYTTKEQRMNIEIDDKPLYMVYALLAITTLSLMMTIVLYVIQNQ